MAVTRTYKCPDCSHEFKFLHLSRDEPAPDYCPSCGEYMGEPLVVPGLFSIGTHKGKAVDLTYRQLEKSSEVRAEMAGDPSLKVTNLKDNLREGDVAAFAPQPSKEYTSQVEGLAAASGQQVNYWQSAPMGASTSQVISYAKSGPDRQSTGAPVLAAIQGGNGMPPPVPSLKGKWGA